MIMQKCFDVPRGVLEYWSVLDIRLITKFDEWKELRIKFTSQVCLKSIDVGIEDISTKYFELDALKGGRIQLLHFPT